MFVKLFICCFLVGLGVLVGFVNLDGLGLGDVIFVILRKYL